jgi:predicted outer membrane repeat protein
VENWGTLTISGCTFDSNVAAGQGGAIRNIGTLSISNSTFSNNSANSGGAIWHSTASQSLAIVNSTFSANSATSLGGAISADDTTSAGTVTLTHVTVSGNISAAGSGGGIYMNNGAAFTLDRTIVAANSAAAGADCAVGPSKSINSLDYNVFGTLTGCSVSGTTTHNVVTATPNLGSLASSGGPTQTVALLAGSAAIDIAPTCSALTDQRGIARPIGGRCDAGAFELQLPLALSPATLASGQVSVPYSQAFTASNGTGPYTFAVTAGAVPGLALSSSGTLSGTPTTGGSFGFTIKVTDTFTSVTGSFPYTLTIASSGASLFRAYLSQNGNDANPCTLPAPCRLLPAALAAVKDRGEVWIMDSANFNLGVVDITKSVTIVSAPGAVGSVLANGADAIHVNAAGVEVALKGLAVSNSGAGNNGIQFSQGAQLTVEDCEINGVATGISAAAPNGLLVVKRSTIRDTTAQGISLQGSVRATLDHSALLGNASYGLLVQNGAQARVSGGTIGGGTTGASVQASAGTSAQLSLYRTVLSNSLTALSVVASAGGDLAQALLDDTTITHAGTGVALSGAGTKTVLTRQNNTFRFNGLDVTGGALTPLAAQ